MSDKHQALLPPMEVKPLSSRLETRTADGRKELPQGTREQLRMGLGSRLTDLLAAACADQIPEKDAAISQGYSPAQWSQIKAGEPGRNAKLDPIADLPIAVQRAFVTAWAARIGCRVVAPDAKRERMLRASAALTDALLAIEGESA